MKKTNNTYDAEYCIAQEHHVPIEHIASAEEYASIPKEHIEPASEFINPPDEYVDTHLEEDTASKKEKKRSLVSKNKLVYFVASTVASFTVFSASFGGGLFGPGNSIDIIENVTEDAGDIDQDISGGQGSSGDQNIEQDSEQAMKPSVPGAYKGILLTGDYEILGARNYLVAFYSMHRNAYGIMNYQGDVLFENNCVGVPDAQGPNAMGYTTFYHSGNEVNKVEVIDASGQVVYTRSDGVDDVAATQLGDCDILYELLPQQEGNDYVKYTKLDGTIIFDSRNYTDKKVKGYPFCNGQALIVADTTATNGGYYTLWVIDYSGNMKKLPDIMKKGASVYGSVNDYFMLRSGSSYALVTTETGEISNWLDLNKCAQTIGESGLRFGAAMYDHFAVYHYGTYAILSENYIVDFKDVTQEGTISTYVKSVYDASPSMSEILVAGTPEYNSKGYHYIDWNGDILSSDHSVASKFNDSGFAMVSDADTDLIYVYDSQFNVVETLSGIVYTANDYGDFVAISLHEPESISGYYYYGDLTQTNTRYLGPIARHAGNNPTAEIPNLDPIEYITVENEAQLKAISEQLETLRKALEGESNSNIAGREEIITALQEILINAETLYFIACTDNACMKNYSDMKTKMKYADLSFYYMTDLIECYETKQTFQTYYRNYLSYHIKTAPEALSKINEQIEFIKDKELTELQEYALSVAGELLLVFRDNKSNLETLYNYTTEYAQGLSDSSLFLTEYNKHRDSITDYWELSPNLNWWPIWMLGGGMG